MMTHSPKFIIWKMAPVILSLTIFVTEYTGRCYAPCINPLALNCSANEDLNERRFLWVKEQPNRVKCMCVCVCVYVDETFVWLKGSASPHISSFSSLTQCCKSK